MVRQQKGKTYKEMYGKEKAEEIKLKISKNLKGKYKGNFEEKYGKKRALKIKEKMSKNNKGIKRGTYNELYGKEKADKIKLKISKKNKERKKGKTYEEMYGKEKAKKIQRKISQKTKIWTKEKIIFNLTEIIKKIGPITRLGLHSLSHYYNICSAETLRIKFGSLDNLAIEGNIEFKLPPNKAGIGSNEKQILDKIEQEKDITLLRQYSIAGRFIDGYDRKNNIAYEVDEWHHKYKRIEDTLRENQIKEVLDCEFVRIPG